MYLVGNSDNCRLVFRKQHQADREFKLYIFFCVLYALLLAY